MQILKFKLHDVKSPSKMRLGCFASEVFSRRALQSASAWVSASPTSGLPNRGREQAGDGGDVKSDEMIST
jgi:hypothetical protein